MAFRAQLDELDILAEDIGFERYVYPHEIPVVSPTHEDRARQRDQTWSRLRRDGIAERTRLQPDADDLIQAWLRPEVLLSHVATDLENRVHFRWRGGWLGKLGFLSRQEREHIEFERWRPAQVVAEIVSLLPDYPALHGPPATAITRTVRSSEPFDDEVEPSITDKAGPADTQAGDRFFAAPALRTGMIKCTRRTPDTRTHLGQERPLGALSWFDTTEGRFFVVTDDLGGGEQRHTFTPAGSARIAQWLRDRCGTE